MPLTFRSAHLLLATVYWTRTRSLFCCVTPSYFGPSSYACTRPMLQRLITRYSRASPRLHRVTACCTPFTASLYVATDSATSPSTAFNIPWCTSATLCRYHCRARVSSCPACQHSTLSRHTRTLLGTCLSSGSPSFLNVPSPLVLPPFKEDRSALHLALFLSSTTRQVFASATASPGVHQPVHDRYSACARQRRHRRRRSFSRPYFGTFFRC